MGFDAGDAVEPLDYDFTVFATKNPIMANAKGRIEEPSDEAVQRMQRRLQSATKKFIPEGVDPNNGAEVARAMSSMPDGAFAEAELEIVEAIAELCNGNPTRDQLLALPYRHKRRFTAWLQRQLMNPES